MFAYGRLDLSTTANHRSLGSVDDFYVDAAAAARLARDAGGLLDRLLVAVTVGVSAMRLEAAVAVALIALRGRGVECHPALASRATRAHPRDESVALEATLLLGPNIILQLREEDQHVFARRLA